LESESLPKYLAHVTFPVLNSLVELCVKHEVRNAVLCPGSRNAPLILAFTRNKNIRSLTFSDERSAAFIALGMAQQTKTPVALVCTSGSAAYNFAPAVAEAFFQNVPLIVITADRPAEWIDQLDGQTIHQPNLYGTHVKKYFELPHDFQHGDARWHAGRILNEALLLTSGPQKGPVHVNAPLREPLYPQGTEQATVPLQATQSFPGEATLPSGDWKSVLSDLSGFKNILLVAGQMENDPALQKAVENCQQQFNWPVAGDILSNLHGLPDFCAHADTFLGQLQSSDKKSLVPDLLITFGKSLIAKNLKLFLRSNKPTAHWHIGIGPAADTFQSLTRALPVSPTYFFTHLATRPIQRQADDFTLAWSEKESRATSAVNRFLQSKQSGEFALLNKVMNELPVDCNLHLANSMSVRYANHIGLTARQRGIDVYSNRGTSGIDGCTSTAVGHALTSTKNNVLITGDLAFFYDRNAFWHNYSLPNLFVVVLNNHGGIIFNLIDGPSSQPEASEFFITKQNLTAKALASEFGFSYVDAKAADIKDFFTRGDKTRILESDCTQAESKEIFNEFKKEIKKIYEA
jgi:2-succinyl-5-enolpyruvyl-6-hydroxy-3-cyclohexene-1-carboxylate synthase